MLLMVRMIRLSYLTVIAFSTLVFNAEINPFNWLAFEKLSFTWRSVIESGISKVVKELKNLALTDGL